MEIKIAERLKNAWNVFKNKESQDDENVDSRYFSSFYNSYGTRPDRYKLSTSNERSIINSIYNRIAIDVSSISIRHVILDENKRFKQYADTTLDYCFTTSGNIDQTGRYLLQDIVMSLLDEGCVAVVPVEMNPKFDEKGEVITPNITSLRVGKITEWYPSKVKVDLYNEKTGEREEVVVDKRSTAIIENPLYAVMNEPNSTLKRLIEKMNMSDIIDSQISSGKLDMIMKLPYAVKTEAKRIEAERVRNDLEEQLRNSRYGIGFVDTQTEITQINRPVENNLMKQIEYLTDMLYNQLGMSKEVLNGTADEQAMLNYHSRTVEPIISAIVDEMDRKYISKIARDNFEKIMFFRDPFRLVPINNIAEIADKFTRNEIMTSNEMRSIIGMLPSTDPKADELRNKNLSQSAESAKEENKEDKETIDLKNDGGNQNGK